MIRAIEELSLSAWPALTTHFYDGWIVRFSNGYTRRANSINPLYESTIDVNKKLAVVEQWYGVHNLPCVFKMTDVSLPTNLDQQLAVHGYTIDAPTSVQTYPLHALPDVQAAGLAVTIDGVFSMAWFDTFAAMNGIEFTRRATCIAMLKAINPPCAFLMVHRDGQAVGVGLGVIERGMIGLFDIVTAPQVRRQGIGTQIMQQLLMWGKHNGAGMAYLQVMLENTPALRLYERMGFTHQYQYWYRQLPPQA